MTETSAPPPPPVKNGPTPWLFAGLAVLAVGGGVLLWRAKGGDPAELPPAPTQTEVVVPKPVPPPPPPPPPPEPSVVEEPLPSAKTSAAKAASTAPVVVGPVGCAGSCEGTPDASFKSALSQMGASARGCYDRALRNNAMLAGKLTIAVRVAQNGSACSASVTSDTLGEPSVSTCVLQKFRSGKYPRPRGGCVDATVPLSFVGQK